MIYYDMRKFFQLLYTEKLISSRYNGLFQSWNWEWLEMIYQLITWKEHEPLDSKIINPEKRLFEHKRGVQMLETFFHPVDEIACLMKRVSVFHLCFLVSNNLLLRVTNIRIVI